MKNTLLKILSTIISVPLTLIVAIIMAPFVLIFSIVSLVAFVIQNIWGID